MTAIIAYLLPVARATDVFKERLRIYKVLNAFANNSIQQGLYARNHFPTDE
jgi:hypothetical protein